MGPQSKDSVSAVGATLLSHTNRNLVILRLSDKDTDRWSLFADRTGCRVLRISIF